MENNEQVANAINVVVENVLASADKNNALAESAKFYGKEIIKFNDEDFRSAIHALKNILAEKINEFSSFTEKHGYELLAEPRKVIAHAINSVEGMNQEKRTILITAITDYDQFSKVIPKVRP